MSHRLPPTTDVPRAGIDPVADEPTALALLRVAANPLRHETILVLLDDTRCGLGLVVVSDTTDPDDVVDVVERVLDPAVHDGRVAGAIVASVRPVADPAGPTGHDLGDADRWLGLDDATERCDVELVEWFVLGDAVSRPRELMNAPPRW